MIRILSRAVRPAVKKSGSAFVLVLAEELPGLLRIFEFEEFLARGVRVDFDAHQVNILVLPETRLQVGQRIVIRPLIRDVKGCGAHRLTISALVVLDKLSGCGGGRWRDNLLPDDLHSIKTAAVAL